MKIIPRNENSLERVCTPICSWLADENGIENTVRVNVYNMFMFLVDLGVFPSFWMDELISYFLPWSCKEELSGEIPCHEKKIFLKTDNNTDQKVIIPSLSHQNLSLLTKINIIRHYN